MPTQGDYERAAVTFAQAAASVATLTSAVEQIDISQAIVGGVLGRTVPERIADASRTARICQLRLDDVATRCSERAAIIAEYLAELERYEAHLVLYAAELGVWSATMGSWAASGGTTMYPGPQPLPPIPPVSPPDWADVPRVGVLS